MECWESREDIWQIYKYKFVGFLWFFCVFVFLFKVHVKWRCPIDSVRVQWFADPMVTTHIFCDVALKGVYTLWNSIPFTAWMECFRHVCQWPCQPRFTDTTLKIVCALPLAHRWLHSKDRWLPLTLTLPAYFRRCKRSESKVSSISAQ